MSTNMADVNRALYKKLHEDFVSGHNGTTTWEITLVASVAPVSVLLRNVLLGVICAHRPNLADGWRGVLDVCCLVLPLFGCITVLADHVGAVLLALLTLTVSVIAVQRQLSHNAAPTHTGTAAAHTGTAPAHTGTDSFNCLLDLAVIGKKPFVTNFRSYANIATAVCILAVDFVIFPRRFCKTETYGTGLMDIAVGGFVVANSIVSPEARGKYPTRRSVGQRVDGILRTFKSTIPLWVLGFCRFAAVKSIDYHEHVSEYGVHWNFFFTLAIVKLLSSLVLSVFDPGMSWLVAVAIASGYEYLLSGLQYRHYVLHGGDGQDSRRTLLEANREGVFSSLGYCAISFAGVQLGTFLWQPRSKLREWVRCLSLLVLADVAFWVLLTYTETHMVAVSRRTANLPYALWIMAYSLHSVACFLLVDVVCIVLQETGTVHAVCSNRGVSSRQGPAPCLLEAINRNALLYFLLANVLTGSVNMLMETVSASHTTGMGVVTGYMTLLSAVTLLLHKYNITVKFW